MMQKLYYIHSGWSLTTGPYSSPPPASLVPCVVWRRIPAGNWRYPGVEVSVRGGGTHGGIPQQFSTRINGFFTILSISRKFLSQRLINKMKQISFTVPACSLKGLFHDIF